MLMAISTLVHKFSYTAWHRRFFTPEAVSYLHCFRSRITQASVGNTMSIFRVWIDFFKQLMTLAQMVWRRVLRVHRGFAKSLIH